MTLSDEQKAAIYTDKPRVIVCAAAGSGKTTCLTERLKYILTNNRINPHNVYAITFTNMAAQEMKQRLGESANGCFIGTIHSLANRILLSNNISTSHLIEDERFDELFELLMQNVNCDNPIKLPQVDYLLVDEFQDIGDTEYTFIMDILKPAEYWVVGDSRQAIYSFLGSNYKFFTALTENPYVEVYDLCNCYRCRPEIVHFANNIIYKQKNIYLTKVHCTREKDENSVISGQFSRGKVVEIIQEINDYKNTAVLCRTNNLADALIGVLSLYNIPTLTFKRRETSLEDLGDKLQENAVKVLTIHSAKGLEWDNVIVCQETAPYNDEEVRINYVAATRARNKLYWLYPLRSTIRRAITGYKKKQSEQYKKLDNVMQEW